MIIRQFSIAMLLGFTATTGFTADLLKMPPLEKRGGTVVGFTQQKAMEHCIAQGRRLPTVREVAQWAVSKGAELQESPNKALAWPLEVDHMQRRGFDAVLAQRPQPSSVGLLFPTERFQKRGGRSTEQDSNLDGGYAGR